MSDVKDLWDRRNEHTSSRTRWAHTPYRAVSDCLWFARRNNSTDWDTGEEKTAYNTNEKHAVSCKQAWPQCVGVGGRGRGGGRAYSFVGCLSRLTTDEASLSRRSAVPTPTRGEGGGTAI